jgi:UDP-N-acetylmuramyl tripeptide synthase
MGQYNVSNLLGVLAAMRTLGVPLADAVAPAPPVAVPGRMERLALAGQPLVAVDYAHTPDALDKACRPCGRWRAARRPAVVRVRLRRRPRPATKRPLMAAVAEKNADRVVVTSDNPRSENPRPSSARSCWA